jgi:hypothetical protein
MHEAGDSPEEVGVLFCPFCERGFTGRLECPEHELLLVPIDELPKRARRLQEGVYFFADPRLGRGTVELGALLVLIGFVAPFARSRGVTASALEIAVDGAANLWFAPGSAIAMLWIAWRRRTRRCMRAARAAVFGLASSGGLPLLYTTHRVSLMSAAADASIDWLWGLWLMAAGLLVCAIGALRFGGRAQAGS